MPIDSEIAVSMAEAEAFARRIGLTWASANDIAALRDAMAAIARAGLVVPRVTSKFIQPAFTFTVAPRAARPAD